MEGKEIMQQHQIVKEGAPSVPQGQTGGPELNLVGTGEEACDHSEEACVHRETGGSECGSSSAPSPGQPQQGAPMGTSPDQGMVRGQPDQAEACTGSAGFPVGGGEYGGSQAPPHMTGGWNPEAAPQQMGPIPDSVPHSAHTVRQPGTYGPPVYDRPIGGPPPWAPPTPGHHQGYFHHPPPAYGYPHHVPHPPMGPAPVFTHAPRPHAPVGGDPHHGPFAAVVGKALQGEATPQDLISGLLNLDFRDDQFWKGVVLGTTAAFLFNSDAVRQALAGALGGLLGKPQDKTQSED